MNKQIIGGASIRLSRVSRLKDKLRGSRVYIKGLKEGKLCSTVGVSRKVMLSRGIKIDLKGRLNGVRRARSIVELEGGIAGNSLCKTHKQTGVSIGTK